MSKYISQDEIDALSTAIYNDDNQALYNLLPDFMETSSNEEDINTYEDYFQIKDTHFYLTKDGRVINARTQKRVTPVFTEKSLVTNFRIRGKSYSIPFRDIFQENGYEYDHSKIIANYMLNEWTLYVSSAYRDRYSHLIK